MATKQAFPLEDALHKLTSIKSGIGVLPIGGCGEFGINMTIYWVNGTYYLVDCGLMFPDSTKLGVDAIVPDIDPIFSILGPPQAYLITHGHEDHIGALPFFFKRWPAPVFATQWTAELIKEKFLRGNLDAPELHVVKAKDRLSLPEVTVDWVQVNHSIPMCCSLVIKAGGMSVVHTGDFKFDDNALYETSLKEQDFSSLLPKGSDLVVADSTNATSSGDCPSEAVCLDSFKKLFAKPYNNIYLATFSSNLWRIRSVLTAAKETGRKVHFAVQVLKRL